MARVVKVLRERTLDLARPSACLYSEEKLPPSPLRIEDNPEKLEFHKRYGFR